MLVVVTASDEEVALSAGAVASPSRARVASDEQVKTPLMGAHALVVILLCYNDSVLQCQYFYILHAACTFGMRCKATLWDVVVEWCSFYRWVPKFSPYGSVCYACAQRPGLPRASPSRARRGHKSHVYYFSMGPKLRHTAVPNIRRYVTPTRLPRWAALAAPVLSCTVFTQLPTT